MCQARAISQRGYVPSSGAKLVLYFCEGLVPTSFRHRAHAITQRQAHASLVQHVMFQGEAGESAGEDVFAIAAHVDLD